MARALIYGCSGTTLSAEERAFFREADPWAFIIFARNVDTPAQLSALVADLRDSVGRDAPVMIDQEGGRVARLRPPHWRAWCPLAEMADRIPDEADLMEALYLRHRIMAHELHALGFDSDCAPVLDLPQPGSHQVIGSRALTGPSPAPAGSAEAALVALRGREACRGLRDGGILPVIKHIPGHGRAMADSHEDLPRTDVPLATLRQSDFLPFRALRDQEMAMTAHLVYAALDPSRPGTVSPAVITAIREEIGFDGLLMTDELTMNALAGSLTERARGALGAGCDIVLHCTGILSEMHETAAECPELSGKALERARRVEAARRAPLPFDLAAAEARHAELTGIPSAWAERRGPIESAVDADL